MLGGALRLPRRPDESVPDDVQVHTHLSSPLPTARCPGGVKELVGLTVFGLDLFHITLYWVVGLGALPFVSNLYTEDMEIGMGW